MPKAADEDPKEDTGLPVKTGNGFNGEVVAIMDNAHRSAMKDGIETIEFSHALAALLAADNEQVQESFRKIGVVPSAVRPTIEKFCRSYPPYRPAGCKFSVGMERVLEFAETKASLYGRPADPRDILYAILCCMNGKQNGESILFTSLKMDAATDLEVLYGS